MRNIYMYICAGLLGVATSCTDLEPEDYSQINTTLFPQTEKDALALMTANVYATFRNNSYGGIFNNAAGVQTIGEMTTDVAACCWGGLDSASTAQLGSESFLFDNELYEFCQRFG